MKKLPDEFARMIGEAGGATVFTDLFNATLPAGEMITRATVNTWVKRGGPPPARQLAVLACLANRGIVPARGELRRTMDEATKLARAIKNGYLETGTRAAA